MFPRVRRSLVLLLLACATLAAEVRSLTILHLNDLHAHISPGNGRGGFAYLAALLARERANCTDCILLNAGDMVQGSPVSTIFRGEPIYQLANLLGFDASCLGNHEFDYGWAQAAKFAGIATFPIVSANVVDAGGNLMTPKPYVILMVNGLRVAVIGGMTEELKTLSTPKTLGEWHTLPLVDTVRRYARELQDQSDLIVLLAHIDGPEENAVLHSVPEIPVLVTGHIHSGMSEALSVEGRIDVRVKSYGEELGRLDLKVDTEKKVPVSWTWKRIPVDTASIVPDAAVAAQVKIWEDKVSAQVDRPLAISNRAFDKAGVKRLIEQALREETHSDFAWMNNGGIRATLPQGQLLDRHIWNIMPFDNDVVIGTFKGRDLPKAVIGDKNIDPDRDYTLAVSDYTAANQGTPENLRTTGLQFPKNAGLMRDLLLDWFRHQKVIENTDLQASTVLAQYAEIHGVRMYYEVHGEGKPVVLLHGGTSNIAESFAEQIPVLAHNHRVIGIEQMGHGHTGDVEGRELSYEAMAEDTAALLDHLGIKKADLVGWSDGGQLALRLAFTHPDLVRRAVASGVGLGAQTAQVQQAMRSLSPNQWSAAARDEYARLSPNGATHWPIFFEKIKMMWAKPEWGITEAELGKIKSPVLIVAGDRDFTRVEETTRIFRMIPGAKLAILPATDHFTFQKRAVWLNPIILDFLDQQ